jgi:hypothetical protein
MSRQQALQMVFIWPHEISLARSGALRLGSLLGPTTTALHLSPLRFRLHSQGLRRSTYTPQQHYTAPQYRRHRVRRGQRNFAPFLALWHAGTEFAEAQREHCHRGAGPRGRPSHLAA